MGLRFWRKDERAKPDQDAHAQAHQAGAPILNEAELKARFDALDQALQAQIRLLDERSRLMADAMTQELRALGHIIENLAQSMAAMNAKLEARSAPRETEPLSISALNAGDTTQDAPLHETFARLEQDEFAPPHPANDTSALDRVTPKRALDPLVLDALAKGRVAFETMRISAIPPRASLLTMLRFAPPLPEIDAATLDRLADLFPDAALLLDRFIMDAAASMLKANQIAPGLPLLVPLSPMSARDAGLAADFRRRFERLPTRNSVVPLLSEQGWINLVETGEAHRAVLNVSGAGFAIRASGQHRIDHSAIGKLGVRYILAPALVLAAHERHALAPDIHPTDVARLFARAGIGLIAEDVPDHVTALGLLRNNIVMGWGPALQADAPAALEPSADQTPSADYRSYLRRAGS